VDTETADTESVDAESADTETVDTESVDTWLADTESAHNDSADTYSADTESTDTKAHPQSHRNFVSPLTCMWRTDRWSVRKLPVSTAAMLDLPAPSLLVPCVSGALYSTS
jgi:hypothetical protein